MANSLPANLLDDRLPDWWRVLGVDLDGEVVRMRRAAAKDLAQGLKAEQLAAAVAYAHGAADAGRSLIEATRAAARSHDESFAGDVGDREPPALVAAALAHHLAAFPDASDSTVLSLLVLSADWQGLHSVIEGQHLRQYAELQLQHASATTRSTDGLSVRPSAKKLVEKELDASQGLPAVDQPVLGSQLSPQMGAHENALTKLAGRVDTLAGRFLEEQLVVRETLQQQAWLLEEWCQTAETPWTQLSLPVVPLVAALELDARTSGEAPAVSTRTLLASTLAKGGHDPSTDVLPLESVKMASGFMEGRMNFVPRAEVFPFASAVSALRATGGEPGWEDQARKSLSSRERSALSVSEQVYRELLVLRMLGNE
ncbi:MAG: GTPase-associated system all-helical protein GASH [Thermoleophilaceae bacterium]